MYKTDMHVHSQPLLWWSEQAEYLNKIDCFGDVTITI